ncbi:light-regulated signal transduction histidine kinase (bacteriophytochrome) [Nocardioides ginsengisegetis]|uniref:Light-regulated signal transduction histidine kinase (Bacteriophytochrome) n=1 Tax=Nocardioides ginsengisegetis TaxID=661491 RepID=A0A7W3J2T2_9ACTN|nr:SpoIIE family protein phosphatase [Nocardioides ginsengisegetis]MBA8805253.1 light-regulated signal transduction histidine kinase (bacteriophytochrome) [Nocardioides ginsengisegetis]
MSATPDGRHTPAYAPADLTNCEDEPIHIPGAIQPHGMLLAVDPPTMLVAVASANCEELVGVAAEEAVGGTLASLVGEAVEDAVRRRLDEATFREPLIISLPETLPGSLAGREVDVTLHRSATRLVIEIETVGRPRSVLLTYQSARSAMARLSAEKSTVGLAAQLAREVAALTDFDRVMVYRFDRQWNGEVIAEERRADLNPFLGLHYPATDIPAQARRLYTVNWTRLIADVHYTPVPLHPILDPVPQAPLDLSHSTLRSVSPIHLEYLQNMGVTSSMSLSLVQDGELWGLVACHHYSGPHRPSQDARAAAEFLSQVASQQIAERERADASRRALETSELLARMLGRLAGTSEPVLDALLDDPEVADLMQANGMALWADGRLQTRGVVPSNAALPLIAGALLGPEDSSIGSTEHVAGLDPRLQQYADLPAGALAIGTLPDRWLVWLRPEFEQTVDWGGDPRNKELASSEGAAVRLSPRKSFDKWREVVRGHSRPWSDEDNQAADHLRAQLNGLLLKRSREQIQVAESLQRSVLAERAPRLEGLDVAVRYTSAASYQLGGDWWDCVRIDDRRTAFVIGDVAGHGVEAVAAMMQVRAALRAYLLTGDAIGSSLDKLDRFVADLVDDQIASALVVVVDREARRLEAASAGHPAPLLLSTDPTLTLRPTARPVLGLGSGLATALAIDVPPGATLLMFTDGLVERRGSDLFDNLRLLEQSAGTGPDEDGLEAWVDRVLAAVPGSGGDDTTVLAVTVR